jgi:PAT family beta-lactamase induction signal transducer AmpG
MGFSPETIGVVAKGVSLWAVIVGSVFGAFIVVRIGINRSLWVFGVVQMVTILGFVVLAQSGADPWVLGIVIAGEYIGVGLGTSASVAFIARETSRLAVATQFALFTALASLPRVVAASFSGLLVDTIGWIDFFYLSTLLAIPGMLLLIWVAPFNARYNATAQSKGGGE